MTDLVIEIRDNGPYRIRGGVTVRDAGGNVFETDGVVALCRCGLSPKKPFCDGTHRSAGFESAPRAN